MQQYISVKTFVKFPFWSSIFLITLSLSGSVFICVLHVHALCGMFAAFVSCITVGLHTCVLFFLASCLVGGSHGGGQTICAPGCEVRLN